MPNNDYKSMLSHVSSLQRQISQLQGQVNKTGMTPAGSDKVVVCTPDGDGGIEFKNGEIVKVCAGNIVKRFTGTETSADSYNPGIVKVGNSGNITGQVYVLTDGIDDVLLSATSATIVAGDRLIPSQSDYTKVAWSESSSDVTAHWIAMEDAVPDTHVRVKFSSRGGVGGGDVAVPCQITSNTNAPEYTVNLHANGKYSPSTGTGTMYILDISYCEKLTVGAWVLGHSGNLPATVSA